MAAAGDAVARYRAATEANDVPGIMATLAPDAELVSPLSGRMVFRGRRDLELLVTAVYGSMHGLHWHDEVGDANRRVVIADGKVGPLRMSDAMIFELDSEDRITRLRPHLRPWLATTVFALRLGPKVMRHPGMVLRALRG
jgi:hypothetical protein